MAGSSLDTALRTWAIVRAVPAHGRGTKQLRQRKAWSRRAGQRQWWRAVCGCTGCSAARARIAAAPVSPLHGWPPCTKVRGRAHNPPGPMDAAEAGDRPHAAHRDLGAVGVVRACGARRGHGQQEDCERARRGKAALGRHGQGVGADHSLITGGLWALRGLCSRIATQRERARRVWKGRASMWRLAASFARVRAHTTALGLGSWARACGCPLRRWRGGHG